MRYAKITRPMAIAESGLCYAERDTELILKPSIMKSEGLLQSSKRYAAKRTLRKWDLPVTGPNQVWHIDMTKIWTDEGWTYLFSIVDAYDRRVVAWDLSRFCRDDEGIRVLEEAVNASFPYGVRGCGLKLVQDNGSQFTSRDFVQTLKTPR
jgi:putative transposase